MTKAIRNYIYLDINLAKSFYAQLVGGVVENMIRREQIDETHQRKEGRRFSAGSSIEAELLWAVDEEKTVVLDDYLFTELESQLQNTITSVDAKNIDRIQAGELIKVSGLAEIDDGRRLLTIMSEFNTFNKYISIMSIVADIEERKLELQNQIIHAPAKQKKQLQSELGSISNTEELFSRLGNAVSPLLIEGLEQILTLLYPDIFEIKISPPYPGQGIFRSIINREYLRDSPERLYAKYSSRTQVTWTLIGQVSTVLEPESIGGADERIEAKMQSFLDEKEVINLSPVSATDDQSTSDDSSDLTIRDAIEGIYSGVTEIEKHLLISNQRKTWIVTPLAIFQEIPIRSSSE